MDLEDERAGREVGRLKRFLPDDANPSEIKKRRERNYECLSALMALLSTDPEYAKLHKDTMDKLRLYELAAERALEEAINRGDQAEIDAIRHYQVDVLGHARDRLTDEDNPPSKDDLKDIQRDIEDRAPQAIRSEIDPGIQNTNKVTQEKFDVESPKL